MKRIDFEHGTITGNILGAALPMLVAQLLSLLYNIVDRIYIARPEVARFCHSQMRCRSKLYTRIIFQIPVSFLENELPCAIII